MDKNLTSVVVELKNLRSGRKITEEKFRKSIISITIRKLDLDFTGMIGRGAFGDSIGVKLPDMENDVAVKVVIKENVGLNETEWTFLKHTNIEPLLETHYFPRLDVQLFMTPIEPFKLERMLKDKIFFENTEAVQKAINWIEDILSAINYLHKKKLSHFNIKTSNVLISTDLRAKLFDFHFLNSTDVLTRSYNMPYNYRPPEAFGNKEANAAVDGRAFDIWCLGIMAINVFTHNYIEKETPNEICSWSDAIYPKIFEVLQKGKFIKHCKSAFPGGHVQEATFKSMRNFATACLFLLPHQRFSAEKLLQHTLFLKIGNFAVTDRIWAKKVETKTLNQRIQEMHSSSQEVLENSSPKTVRQEGNAKPMDADPAENDFQQKTTRATAKARGRFTY